jgi:hypothetical protein
MIPTEKYTYTTPRFCVVNRKVNLGAVLKDVMALLFFRQCTVDYLKWLLTGHCSVGIAMAT